ncbi:MAG: hypothetical protein QG646_2483 [Euryarchaeota archaeon]|nr:hypothetical protein [Euryarchaeota archaeon]
MDTINQLNPHPYRASIRGSGELTDIMPVDFMHNRYQDYLKLLKKRKLKLIHIACLYGNSGSNFEVSIFKVLAGRMFVWREIEA